MGSVVSRKKEDVPKRANKHWRWYRWVIHVISLVFVGVMLYDAFFIALQLAFRRATPASYEAPHAFLVIPLFSVLQTALLLIVAHARRSEPVSPPTEWKLWLGVISTIVHFFAMLGFSILVIIFEAVECGSIVCGISDFFTAFAIISFILICLELLADIGVFVMLIYMGRLTYRARTDLEESLEERERESVDYRRTLRDTLSDQDEDFVVTTFDDDV